MDLHVVTFSSITTTNSLCDSIPVLLLLLVLALVKIFEVPPVVSNVAIKDTFWPPLVDPDQDDYHQFHFAAILGFSL